MRLNSIILVAGLMAASAMADTVYLVNGGILEGRVSYEDGRIVVEQANGKVYLDKSKIDHIENNKTTIDEYDDKLAAIKAKSNTATAEEWAQLGRFAADHNLRERAERSFFKALALDPENTTARLGLGYEKFQDRWMTSEEANQARGMVKHNGAWVTPEAKADLLKVEAKTETERARAAAETAKAEQERLKVARLDKELELVEVERERLRELREYGVREYVGGVNYAPPSSCNVAPAPAPVAAPRNTTPPPTTSFGAVQVDTPDATVRLGTGGNIVVQPKR